MYLRLETDERVVYERKVQNDPLWESLFGMSLASFLRNELAGNALVDLTAAWVMIEHSPNVTPIKKTLKHLITASIDWPDAYWRTNE